MRKPWGIALPVLAAALLSCNLFNNVIQSSSLDSGSSPTGPNPSGRSTLYQDDFEDSGSGWTPGDFDNGTADYSSGTYSVSSDGDGYPMYGVANQTFGDVDIEVDSLQVAAPPDDNNDYGIGCRIQDNGDGYYLLISGDGYASIQLAVDGSFSNLVDWEESSAVHTGNASNHLRAVCSGSRLDLYINGQHALSQFDDTFGSGDVALTATSYESGPTEIHFDNLVVHQP
jgi:hypothetical protein